jgi:hypothetical protein
LTVLAKAGGVRPGETFTHSEENFGSAYTAVIRGSNIGFFQYDLTEYYAVENPLSGNENEVSTTMNFIVGYVDLAKDVTDVVMVHRSLLDRLNSFGKYKDMQKLELEGDFNDNYDTYILPGTQDDALELLTPDTMELALGVADSASMEFGEKSLIVSLQGKAWTPEVVQPLLENVAALAANVEAKRAD